MATYFGSCVLIYSDPIFEVDTVLPLRFSMDAIYLCLALPCCPCFKLQYSVELNRNGENRCPRLVSDLRAEAFIWKPGIMGLSLFGTRYFCIFRNILEIFFLGCSYLDLLCNVDQSHVYPRAGVSRPIISGCIWPATCFCMVCQLKIFFTFLSGSRIVKRRLFCDCKDYMKFKVRCL